jgi:GT2 family glycosyltransferase
VTILFIPVNYASDASTVAWIEAILRLRLSERARVVVVDNTPRPQEQIPWKKGRSSAHSEDDPQVQWIAAPKNLGYFGGADFGLSHYLARAPLPEWVIVSNVDLDFGNADFLTGLTPLQLPDDCGIVAPSIRSTRNGKDQNPYMAIRPSAARMHWIKWVTATPLRLLAYKFGSRMKGKMVGALSTSIYPPQPIYAPHGSCLLFHKRYFEWGGTLKHPCFLFGEEIFVAESARRLGLRVWFEPSLKLLHREHETTDIMRNRVMAAYVAQASAYCADTYF